MFEVDRVAAVIKPTAAMFDWLKNHPSKYDSVTLESLRKDCIVLLIPAFDGPRQSMEYIKQIYKGIFEAELISWGLAEQSWPKNRSLEIFLQWFEIEFHSVIYDVAYAEETAQKKERA
jgi:hypothetical protein